MVDARTRICANAACNKQMVEAHTDRRRCHEITFAQLIAIAAAANIAATPPAASGAFQLRKQTNAARRPPEGAYGTEQSVSAVTECEAKHRVANPYLGTKDPQSTVHCANPCACACES